MRPTKLSFQWSIRESQTISFIITCQKIVAHVRLWIAKTWFCSICTESWITHCGWLNAIEIRPAYFIHRFSDLSMMSWSIDRSSASWIVSWIVPAGQYGDICKYLYFYDTLEGVNNFAVVSINRSAVAVYSVVAELLVSFSLLLKTLECSVIAIISFFNLELVFASLFWYDEWQIGGYN
jgi:hypothetical protein